MATIKRSILILLSIAVGIHAQDNTDDENGDLGDYSEPGAPTENCLCLPFFKCSDRDAEEEVPEDVDEEEKYMIPRKPIRGRSGCGPYNVCCKNPRNETAQPPYQHRCGQRNSATMSGRIVNTQTSGQTEIAEWPWQAALLRKHNGDFLFKCGGTLIDEQHVLTVAHCVAEFTDFCFRDNIQNLNVRLGEWDTQTSSADFPHEDYAVSQIIIHPEYKPRKFYNDIAILKLEKPVEFKPHIDTACLPKSTDIFEGQKCIVTGWGKDAFVDGAYSPVMKKVVLPVVGHDDCEDQLRTTKLGRKFELHHGFICAGGKEDEDSCTGDGGGPLVCFDPDTYSYILTGLVSWGVECGKPGVPGVYVDVQRYLDWISSITAKPLPEYWARIMHTLSWVILVFISFTEITGAETSITEAIEDYDYDDYLEPTTVSPSEDCICVPFYRCDDGKIVDDGNKTLKPRRLLPRDISTARKSTNSPECELNHVCCRRQDSEDPAEELSYHKCGNRSPIFFMGRVVNSKTSAQTEFGEWPWQAAILKRSGAAFFFVCGGTLIDDQHVLTTAHCVTGFRNNDENLVVRLGEWDTRAATETYPHENFNVSQVLIHPDYRFRNYQNDIAILKLQTEVDFKPHINMACLPREDDNFTNQTCVVTGWGQDAFKNGSFTQVMKKVSLPVIGHRECQEKLRNTILGPRFKLHSGFFCAGGKEGEDSCTGDGGGPLVCLQEDNTYVLAGIVSWGLECGTKDVPGVYVNVQKYVNWISSSTGNPVEEYWKVFIMQTLSWVVLIVISLVAQKVASDHDDPEDFNVSEDFNPEDYDPSNLSDIDYSEESSADSSECICTPFYKCDKGIIIEDGSKDIKPRRGSSPKPNLGVDSRQKRQTSSECPLNHVCCRKFKSKKKPTESPHLHQNHHKCGKRNPMSTSGRIVSTQGVSTTEFGEWPWQAAIIKRTPQYTFACGGTLIDDNHILTAAHCVADFMNNFDDLEVRLGEHDTASEKEAYPHENFKVIDVNIHPDYRSSNYHNDIAILKLEKKVVFKPHIDVVCLPRDEDDFVGEKCYVTGWGEDAFASGVYSQVMKKVSLPVLEHSECQNKFRKTVLGHFFKLHGSFLCAGGKQGEDACTGDGGGPLVCYQPDNTYVLAGIVSWGLECGAKDVPGVYVNVQKFSDWISSYTEKPVEHYWRKD
ncbi:uncharacterized protein LOC129216425 [Uloborus diversus]|uniref:uncharacterized protein LOC129216425 n=1 Tax=Uloborus diversus TaxID=327109 RepID=UPI002409D309|nr:uncharacterized protein LOC129216425 [Uloborus diversus]